MSGRRVAPPLRFDLRSLPPDAVYAAARGYGYEPGNPRLFSVAVPEGNYDVRLVCGHPKEPTEMAVRAEARRLMVESVTFGPGQEATKTFTVNVRTPALPGGGAVKLKPREIGPPRNPNWDEKLTLEFAGARPQVATVEVIPNPDAPTVFLLGDSTVTDQPGEPYAAWGQMLPRFFQPGIAVANHAESGESLRSSLASLRVEKVLTSLRNRDYLLIQYGHNDQKEKGPGVGALTTYRADLKRVANEAKRRGATVVLVTPMYRRRFDAAGKLYDTLGDYPEAVRQVSREDSHPLIDLHAVSGTLFQALGVEESKKAFLHIPAGVYPGQRDAIKDDTHFSAYGAYLLARCVVEGLRVTRLPLTRFLAPDLPPFDPARPDPASAFRLPPSPPSTARPPDGS